MMKSQVLVYLPFDHLTPELEAQGLAVFPHIASMHKDRIKGFLLARICLLQAFFEQGIKLELTDLKGMQVTKLPTHQEFSFSLSHTLAGNLGVAGALLGHQHSVGLDLEWRERPIKSGASHYFLREEDAESSDLLALWCKKEACFKSISHLYDPGLLLKDLWIAGNNFGHHTTFPKPLGHTKMTTVTYLGKELLVATATHGL